jgi:hypothetical protein
MEMPALRCTHEPGQWRRSALWAGFGLKRGRDDPFQLAMEDSASNLSGVIAFRAQPFSNLSDRSAFAGFCKLKSPFVRRLTGPSYSAAGISRRYLGPNGRQTRRDPLATAQGQRRDARFQRQRRLAAGSLRRMHVDRGDFRGGRSFESGRDFREGRSFESGRGGGDRFVAPRGGVAGEGGGGRFVAPGGRIGPGRRGRNAPRLLAAVRRTFGLSPIISDAGGVIREVRVRGGGALKISPSNRSGCA